MSGRVAWTSACYRPRSRRVLQLTRARDFPFATDIRVRFAETDAQGVAHNSAYLVWFEVARVEYLERFAGGYPRLRERASRRS